MTSDDQTDASIMPLNQLGKGKRPNLKKGKAVDVALDMTLDKPATRRLRLQTSISVIRRYDAAGKSDTSFTYNEKLLQKVEENNYEACEELLKDGADLKVKDKGTGRTALHIAAKNDHPDIVRLLIDYGAEVNAQDNTDQAPLHLAAAKDHFSCCQILVDCEDIEINIKNKTNDTPLHYAAKSGRNDICAVILNSGKCNINSKNKKGLTPLHIAAQEDHHQIIQFLLNKGADWKIADNYFHLPLHYAAKKGFDKSCKILMSMYNNGDTQKQLKHALKDGKTPLMLAAKGGHHRCCVLLSNINISAQDKEGNTALHYAVAGGFVNTVADLLNMEAKLDITNKKGISPVLIAAGKKKPAIFKMLIEKGARLDVYDQQRKNVFHYAAEKNAVECLEYLLSQNLTVSLLDKSDMEGYSPLHIAIKRECFECAHLLLDKGASPTKECQGGTTPLHLAADKGNTSICEKLLACKKVNVSKENDNKATPLHMAAFHGSINVCQMLLHKGARLTAVDKNGRTALHIAALQGYSNVVKYLTKRGIPLRAQDDTGSTAVHLAAAKGSLQSCKVLVASAKASCLETDQNGLIPLNRAYDNQHDEVFKYLLQQMPYKENDQDLYLCLHDYMHGALRENRMIVVEAIVESSWWKAGFIGAVGHHCFNFRTLVEAHPNLAQKAMDKCISPSTASSSSVSFSVYDFRLFEDNYYIPSGMQVYVQNRCKIANNVYDHNTGQLQDKHKTRKYIRDNLEWKKEHPLTLMVKHGHHRLLHHKLTLEWLLIKWRLYISYIFLALLILEILFVAILNTFMYHVENWSNVHNTYNVTKDQFCQAAAESLEFGIDNVTSTNNTNVLTALTNIGDRADKKVVWVVLLVFSGLILLLEVNYIRRLKKEYLNGDNLMRILRVVLTVVVLVPHDSCEFNYLILGDEQWQCGIIALLVSWLHLINTINQLPICSVFMPITHSFIKSFIKIVVYIAMLIFVFAFSFYLLLRDQPAFTDVPQAMVKTIVWMLGDLGYDDTFLNDEQTLDYPVMTNFLFVLFVTVIGGFIVNLIITQPSEKLDSYRSRAAFHRAASRCNLFLKLDVCFPTFQQTRGFYNEANSRKVTNNLKRLFTKLLMLDTPVEDPEPPDPLQLLLEEQTKQISALVNMQQEQYEEIKELKHQIIAFTRALPASTQP